MEDIERNDRKIALIVLFVAFALGFLAGKVFACDSYEDCMNPKVKPCQEYIGSQKQLDGTWKPNFFTKSCEEPNYLKAIAYKLDEISNWKAEILVNQK